MNDPQMMKRHVFVRDKGTCQRCGMFRPLMGDFDADHIKPLFEAHGDPRYYEPDNLQLLCDPCHKLKTKADMDLYRRVYKPLKTGSEEP